MYKTLVIGSIPYSTFKQKNRLINELKRDIGKMGRKVSISVENSLILYEYYEFSS